MSVFSRRISMTFDEYLDVLHDKNNQIAGWRAAYMRLYREHVEDTTTPENPPELKGMPRR